MNIHLENKSALVGGASTGLGLAVALALAECGARVCLVSHNEQKLQKALAQLPKNHGQEHRYLVADYKDFVNYQKLISDFFSKNTIDILVNNTQGPSAGNISQLGIEDYQEAFDLLFKVNCFTTLQALERMQQKAWGRIINLSSISVKEPMPNLVLSNTMRSAWQSWCKSLAEFYANKGITVNTILTGLFNTERITQLAENQAKQLNISFDEALQQSLSSIPIGRLGEPSEFGAVAAFLASEQASFLTGASIPLDGGSTKGK